MLLKKVLFPKDNYLLRVCLGEVEYLRLERILSQDSDYALSAVYDDFTDLTTVTLKYKGDIAWEICLDPATIFQGSMSPELYVELLSRGLESLKSSFSDEDYLKLKLLLSDPKNWGYRVERIVEAKD